MFQFFKMQKYLIILLICVVRLKFSLAEDVSLTSRNFQKQFLQDLSDIMKKSALQYVNGYLQDLQAPSHMDDSFAKALTRAKSSKKLDMKIIFLKQWFDMAEHRDANRENMYGLRNVLFLQKMKQNLGEMQEKSFEEIHNLRYFYLCKQFNISGSLEQERKKHLNGMQLAPFVEQNIGDMLQHLGVRDQHSIIINTTEFGWELYKQVNHTGSTLINDYLVIIKRLLQDVLDNQEEESMSNNKALQKILQAVDELTNTTDFYAKRQRLYGYLQNQLALDYEEFQNSETSQQDLMQIFDKLKQKGLDVIVAFLFSNFEFVDYTHDQWTRLMPAAPLALFDEASGSRALRNIQLLYAEFKQDFENSAKYDAYLEAVKELHERTQRDNADTSHIFEMLYSASQNVGSSRSTLMNAKCNEI